MDTYRELINEICAEENIICELISFDWIYRLSRDGALRHIVGRHFDLNPAAADRLACDKYACYLSLRDGGVPAIEHALFFDPRKRPNLAEHSLPQALAFLKEHSRVVVKPNNGFQGRDVFRCETEPELEQALRTVFEREPTACLCPFYDFEHEYRVFYLDGDCPYGYGKERAEGAWKHNLSGGATAFEVNDRALIDDLKALAQKAARRINIRFATVDIARLRDGTLKVLEINAGVVASKLLEQIPQQRNTIKKIYAQAIRKLFA